MLINIKNVSKIVKNVFKQETIKIIIVKNVKAVIPFLMNINME